MYLPVLLVIMEIRCRRRKRSRRKKRGCCESVVVHCAVIVTTILTTLITFWNAIHIIHRSLVLPIAFTTTITTILVPTTSSTGSCSVYGFIPIRTQPQTHRKRSSPITLSQLRNHPNTDHPNDTTTTTIVDGNQTYTLMTWNILAPGTCIRKINKFKKYIYYNLQLQLTCTPFHFPTTTAPSTVLIPSLCDTRKVFVLFQIGFRLESNTMSKNITNHFLHQCRYCMLTRSTN